MMHLELHHTERRHAGRMLFNAITAAIHRDRRVWWPTITVCESTLGRRGIETRIAYDGEWHSVMTELTIERYGRGALIVHAQAVALEVTRAMDETLGALVDEAFGNMRPTAGLVRLPIDGAFGW